MKKENLPQHAKTILKILRKEFPEAATALHYSNPLQLLVAVILSAQCTDVRVNLVTPNLFKKYKTAQDFSNANISELEELIRSTGFYKNKAKNIIECCKALVEKHNGKIPQTMEELTALAGVGRKTANCVLGAIYNVAYGVVVDTHVKRISYRLGLTTHTNPEKIEQDLMEILPQKEWYYFSNAIILHGRKTCIARKPKCDVCVMNMLCPSKRLQKF